MSTRRSGRPTIGRKHHGHISHPRFALSIVLVLIALLALIFLITLLAPSAGGQSTVLAFHATAPRDPHPLDAAPPRDGRQHGEGLPPLRRR